MSKKPQIIKKTILAQSPLFTIEGLHLRFNNGEERCYERVAGRVLGSVMIVPLLDDNTMLLVREYAAGVDDYILAFPKGAVAPGEDLLQTANRELTEEVGYRATRLSVLARVSSAPSYNTSVMSIILAEGLVAESAVGDEPEPIEVVPWKLSERDALLQHPEFHEARSLAALLLLEKRLHE